MTMPAGPSSESRRAGGWPRLQTSSVTRSAAGFSMLEILIVAALVLGVGVSGLRALHDLRQRQAGREAARMLLHDLQQVARRARTTGTARGIRLTVGEPGDVLEEFEDGNGNGVKVAEIAAGVDRAVAPPRPAFREGQARLAIVRTVPTTDQAGTLSAGEAPVRFGVSALIVFTPRRTASSGSIYVAGPDERQYAIRVLGTTQRWRLLCLDDRTATWEGC